MLCRTYNCQDCGRNQQTLEIDVPHYTYHKEGHLKKRAEVRELQKALKKARARGRAELMALLSHPLVVVTWTAAIVTLLAVWTAATVIAKVS